MNKVLNSYFPEGLEGNGIFTAISQISWFPSIVPAHLDTYFMLKHGDKLASKVCDKFADDDGHITGVKLTALAKVIHNAYITNWEHEYKTLTVEYNPIENTDFVETIKDATHKENEGSNVTTGKMTVSNDNTTTGSFDNTNVTTGSMSVSNEVNVAGFNSATTVPSSDGSTTTDYDSGVNPVTVTNTTDYGTENDNPLTVSSSATTDYGTKSGTPMTIDNTGSEDGTYERELRKHGNSGVTTNAQMIESDIDVWQLNNFYDILCKDICKVIALSIY